MGGKTGGTLNHSGTFTVPYLSYDAQGHITSSGSKEYTLPALPTNHVTYTKNTNVTTHIGTGKTTYTYDPVPAVLSGGLIMGGSAAGAGLVTRGLCGVTTPSATGACSKENLYINYDSDNTYRASRQVVLQAGTVGTHYGNNLYQYAAARGDAVKGYGDAHYQPKGEYALKTEIPTVNNGKLTIQVNGTEKGTFTANQSGNTPINITAADLGLSSAMKFVGTTTTPLYDGRDVADIEIDGETYTPVAGDVAIVDKTVTENNDQEFLFNGST